MLSYFLLWTAESKFYRNISAQLCIAATHQLFLLSQLKNIEQGNWLQNPNKQCYELFGVAIKLTITDVSTSIKVMVKWGGKEKFSEQRWEGLV